MKYTIDKNVPHPPRKRKFYPFAQLEIGDSFFVEDSKKTVVRAHLVNFRRANPGLKFVTGKVEGGVRVWRTE